MAQAIGGHTLYERYRPDRTCVCLNASNIDEETAPRRESCFIREVQVEYGGMSASCANKAVDFINRMRNVRVVVLDFGGKEGGRQLSESTTAEEKKQQQKERINEALQIILQRFSRKVEVRLQLDLYHLIEVPWDGLATTKAVVKCIRLSIEFEQMDSEGRENFPLTGLHGFLQSSKDLKALALENMRLPLLEALFVPMRGHSSVEMVDIKLPPSSVLQEVYETARNLASKSADDIHSLKNMFVRTLGSDSRTLVLTRLDEDGKGSKRLWPRELQLCYFSYNIDSDESPREDSQILASLVRQHAKFENMALAVNFATRLHMNPLRLSTTSLRCLTIQGFSQTPVDAEELRKVLQHNNLLAELNIFGILSPITAFLDGIRNSKALESLSIDTARFLEGADLASACFHADSKILRFKAAQSLVMGSGDAFLSVFVESPASLRCQSLSLPNADITFRGAELLSRHMHRLKDLGMKMTLLDLGGNSTLRSSGLKILFAALEETDCLESLDIGGLILELQGLRSLSQCLPKLRNLKKLCIRFPTRDGADLMTSFQRNKSLLEVECNLNQRRSEWWQLLAYTYRNRLLQKAMDDEMPLSLLPVTLEWVRGRLDEEEDAFRHSLVYSVLRYRFTPEATARINL